MKNPRTETVEESIDDAIHALVRVRRDYAWLLDRGLDWSWSPVRGAHFGDGVAGGDVSDPTGSVAADERFDPALTVRDWLAEVTEVVAHALVCDSHRAHLMPVDLEREVGELWCVNCIRYGVKTVPVPGKGGRCWACYRYRLRHDLSDRPESLVLAGEK